MNLTSVANKEYLTPTTCLRRDRHGLDNVKEAADVYVVQTKVRRMYLDVQSLPSQRSLSHVRSKLSRLGEYQCNDHGFLVLSFLHLDDSTSVVLTHHGDGAAD